MLSYANRVFPPCIITENLLYARNSFEYPGIPPQIGGLANLKDFDCSFNSYFGELDESMWDTAAFFDGIGTWSQRARVFRRYVSGTDILFACFQSCFV